MFQKSGGSAHADSVVYPLSTRMLGSARNSFCEVAGGHCAPGERLPRLQRNPFGMSRRSEVRLVVEPSEEHALAGKGREVGSDRGAVDVQPDRKCLQRFCAHGNDV